MSDGAYSLARMFSETRRDPRYPFVATAIMKVQGKESPGHITSLANNISPSGMGLRTYTAIEKGATATIEIIFSDGRGKRERDIVEGTVAWISKLGKLYLLGVSFIERINPSQHPKLFRRLNDIVRST